MVTTLQVLTDVHAGSPAEGHASNRKLSKLAPAVLDSVLQQGAARGDIQAVLSLGDLIEHSGAAISEHLRAETDEKNFRNTLRSFDSLTVPTLHCIGNHPLMILMEDVITSALGLEQPYYARDIGEHRIIMLHSRFRHKRDSGGHKSGSGIYIDDQQLSWLRKELESTDRNVLVCSHHPLDDQDLRGNIWFEKYPQCAHTENRRDVQEILATYGNVVAVASGHTHWNYLSKDNFGTTHITLQSLSENFRGDGTPAGTYGVMALKDAAFNLEIFGNDLALRNAAQDPEHIAEECASTYNSIAEIYDSKTQQFGSAEIVQYERLFEFLLPGHGNRVVDFGCGPGRDVHYWEKRKFAYTGVDISERFMEIARVRNPGQTFLCENFTTASLPRNAAAIAIHNSSLQHVPRIALDATLRKVFDTLEPGGLFYCHYRSGETQSLSISTEYGRPISRFIALYTEEEMEAALRRVGFDVIGSETFDHKYEGLKGKVVQYKTRTYARKPGHV